MDPLTPAPVNLVLLRRIRRSLSNAIQTLDQLERRAREAGR
jgi:hypothetical protein